MKKQSKQLLLMLALFFSSTIVFAQERQITGIVKDYIGVPVANASVLIKGTNVGTTTDGNGHFKISIKNPGTILEISSVGFQSKDIPVAQNSLLEVVLEADKSTMQEVVVTALGIPKQKKQLPLENLRQN